MFVGCELLEESYLGIKLTLVYFGWLTEDRYGLMRFKGPVYYKALMMCIFVRYEVPAMEIRDIFYVSIV
jgi:hypothetical protein